MVCNMFASRLYEQGEIGTATTRDHEGPAKPGHAALLSIGSSRPFEGATLGSLRGGFAWWYCDLCDARGNGVVVIASLGLPFLPGARATQRPVERPSLCVAGYRGGREAFYALTELPAARVTSSERALSFSYDGGALELRADDDSVTLLAVAALPLAGTAEPLRFSMAVNGPRVAFDGSGAAARDADAVAGDHAWTPLSAMARGRARISLGGESMSVEGRAYVDGNASRRPLHELGIHAWDWGRLALPDRELVYYLVAPERAGDAPVRVVLETGADGTTKARNIDVVGRFEPQRNAFGLRWQRELHLAGAELDLRVRARHVVDDGPFYQRYLLEASCARTGAHGFGFGERVVPARVDRGWQRPLVRMRRHLAGGPNSAWLPLFEGPRSGRLGRLVSHWLGASPASAAARGGEVRP